MRYKRKYEHERETENILKKLYRISGYEKYLKNTLDGIYRIGTT